MIHPNGRRTQGQRWRTSGKRRAGMNGLLSAFCPLPPRREKSDLVLQSPVVLKRSSFDINLFYLFVFHFVAAPNDIVTNGSINVRNIRNIEGALIFLSLSFFVFSFFPLPTLAPSGARTIAIRLTQPDVDRVPLLRVPLLPSSRLPKAALRISERVYTPSFPRLRVLRPRKRRR